MKNINLIVAVGSPEGVAVSAALMNAAGNQIPVVFTRNLCLNPKTWEKGRNVTLVGLTANEETKALVDKICNAGHNISGVIDKSGKESWAELVPNFETLDIKPGMKCESTGLALINALGSTITPHAKTMCETADKLENCTMQFDNGSIAEMINCCIGSDAEDMTRCKELANHFAFRNDSDNRIEGWISEYKSVVANNKQVIENGIEIAPQIFEVNVTNKRVDMRGLTADLLQTYPVVAALNKDRRQLTISANVQGGGNLPNLMKREGIEFTNELTLPNAVCVDTNNQEMAINAIKKMG